jgi:formate-dependent nitrite reductase membrane component NrfD
MAVGAAGGGATGITNLTIINSIKPQLTYLEKVGPKLVALQAKSNESAAEWQHWFWVCFGGIAVFLPLIFVLKGRWSPKKAGEDEEAHRKLVEVELARLQAEKAGATA